MSHSIGAASALRAPKKRVGLAEGAGRAPQEPGVVGMGNEGHISGASSQPLSSGERGSFTAA